MSFITKEVVSKDKVEGGEIEEYSQIIIIDFVTIDDVECRRIFIS